LLLISTKYYLCAAPDDQLLQNSPRAEMQQGYVVERCVRRFFFALLRRNVLMCRCDVLAHSVLHQTLYFVMQFFVDTANLNEIREAAALGILDGVTTNPSLMAKEGIKGDQNILNHYVAICDIVGADQDVSAEVISTDFDGMVKEGEMLAGLHENIVVKVPMTRDGIKAISHFTREGIKTNCTLVFSAGQAILAAKAGATYLSPFVGRVDDISWDGIGLIKEIYEIYQIAGYETAILAASIRSPLHIVQAAKAGADVVTCPLSAILGLLNHPLTDIGLAKFLADHNK
jgi:transaldolase